MPYLNQCNFIGNVGKDAEMRYTQQGNAVCNWSVAVTKKRNGQEETMWVECSAWNKLAETANQYVRKGAQIYVSGELTVEAYADKQGNPRAQAKLNVYNYQLLGQRGEGSAASGSDDGEIPF